MSDKFTFITSEIVTTLTIRPARSDSSPKHPNQKNPDNYSTNSVYLRTFA